MCMCERKHVRHGPFIQRLGKRNQLGSMPAKLSTSGNVTRIEVSSPSSSSGSLGDVVMRIMRCRIEIFPRSKSVAGSTATGHPALVAPFLSWWGRGYTLGHVHYGHSSPTPGLRLRKLSVTRSLSQPVCLLSSRLLGRGPRRWWAAFSSTSNSEEW